MWVTAAVPRSLVFRQVGMPFGVILACRPYVPVSPWHSLVVVSHISGLRESSHVTCLLTPTS